MATRTSRHRSSASSIDESIRRARSAPPATGVVVTDALPSGVAFVSVSAACVELSLFVTCAHPTAFGGREAFSISASVLEQPLGCVIAKVATVASDQDDPDESDSVSAAEVVVRGLLLAKTAVIGPGSEARQQRTAGEMVGTPFPSFMSVASHTSAAVSVSSDMLRQTLSRVAGNRDDRARTTPLTTSRMISAATKHVTPVSRHPVRLAGSVVVGASSTSTRQSARHCTARSIPERRCRTGLASRVRPGLLR